MKVKVKTRQNTDMNVVYDQASVTEARDGIMNGIRWSCTEEGTHYWTAVHDKLDTLSRKARDAEEIKTVKLTLSEQEAQVLFTLVNISSSTCSELLRDRDQTIAAYAAESSVDGFSLTEDIIEDVAQDFFDALKDVFL